MTTRKLSPLTQDRQTNTGNGGPSGEGNQNLRQQAASYGTIARNALQECKGERDADEVLRRRRNRSGQ